MKLTIFGLAVSSSWGNGHATIWRGLCRAMAERGHRIVFFERDAPYYAQHRDLADLPGGGELRLYSNWQEALPAARRHLSDSDVAMVTSYCPDGVEASELVLSSPARLRAFYDLDAPVTLERLRAGQEVSYVGPRGYRDFDIVLSYTGGAALDELKLRLGARKAVPLHGSVDPGVHGPAPAVDAYRADLSYIGTYAADRQEALEALFMEPARRLPGRRFILAGSLYPADFPWTGNISFLQHLPPHLHPAFYCSSTLTLNVTRGAMAAMGYCPSARLFEAASCGVPIVSDHWEGLDRFFDPGSEIIIARTAEDVVAAMELSPRELGAIAEAGRERALREHTAARRAEELETILDAASSSVEDAS